MPAIQQRHAPWDNATAANALQHANADSSAHPLWPQAAAGWETEGSAGSVRGLALCTAAQAVQSPSARPADQRALCRWASKCQPAMLTTTCVPGSGWSAAGLAIASCAVIACQAPAKSCHLNKLLQCHATLAGCQHGFLHVA